MVMAHSVGKAFHLISDTEAGEECARPSDTGGGALHTAAFADQRRMDAAGGGVHLEAVALSVHKEVFIFFLKKKKAIIKSK